MNTKMKMTLVAGALALAVAGQANAAIVGNSTTAGGSDLILSVWDTTTQMSYTADLGLSMTAFLASPTTAISFGPDANMTSFMAGVAATDVTLWNVVAMNSVNSNYLFTDTAAPAAQAAAVVKTFNSASDGFMTAVAAAAGTAKSVIVNNAVNPTGYAGSTTFADTFGGKLSGSNASAIGTSMGFYSEIPVTKTASTVTAFSNTFALSSTGALTYGTVAAVPEPGEWLLMLSGLALIGFIATRRKEENSMTFA